MRPSGSISIGRLRNSAVLFSGGEKPVSTRGVFFTRPRGAATPGTTWDTVRCGASVFAGVVCRRRSLRTPAIPHFLGFSYSFLARQASKTPGGRGPGVPLGTRTAPTGCFIGLFSTKRDTNGCGWSSILPGVATPTTWALTFSPEWPTKRPVGAVFSCVASRNTHRVSYWPGGRGAARHSKTGIFSAQFSRPNGQ